MKRFFDSIKSEDPDSFKKAAEKLAKTCLVDYSAHDLSSASDELLKEAADHEKTHDAASSCTLPQLLRIIAEIAKSTASSQLQ
jgi:hypothetical protein